MLASTKRATCPWCVTSRRLASPYKSRCIWQTTEVTIQPLIEVAEAFAWDEGEGDRTRTSWLNGHRRYFARQASREGFVMDDQIPTVFERFKVTSPIWRARLVAGPLTGYV
jgi:uncharacterized protein YhfF